MRNQKVELTTILGKSCLFRGNLKIKGGLKIDGDVEGDIDCDNIIIIGITGKIIGTVKANECIISGMVEGDLSINGLLELEKTAKIVGNVSAKNLYIHPGAILNGMCNMHPVTEIKK